MIETDLSWVFSIKDHACKLKFPVRLDFVDCRTIEARWRFCETDIRLNQRPALGVYLGKVSLAQNDKDQLGLHGDGVVID